MKSNKQFSLNWSLYIISALLWILGIIPFALMSFPQNPTYQELMLAAFYIVIFTTPAIMLSWSTFQQKELKYTETGVSQPKLFGIITIRWDEVTEVKFGSNLQIYAGDKKVSISLLAHKEPQKILEFIKANTNSSGKLKS